MVSPTQNSKFQLISYFGDTKVGMGKPDFVLSFVTSKYTLPAKLMRIMHS